MYCTLTVFFVKAILAESADYANSSVDYLPRQNVKERGNAVREQW